MNRRLYRSRKNVMLGGVAAGLAEYFDVDVTLVRLIWLMLVFVGGTGVVAYIIAWIIIPQEPLSRVDLAGRPLPPVEHPDEQGNSTGESSADEIDMRDTRPVSTEEDLAKRRRGAGIVLIILGAAFLLNQVIPRIFHDSWPLLLVLVGAYLLYDASRGRNQ